MNSFKLSRELLHYQCAKILDFTAKGPLYQDIGEKPCSGCIDSKVNAIFQFSKNSTQNSIPREPLDKIT